MYTGLADISEIGKCFGKLITVVLLCLMSGFRRSFVSSSRSVVFGQESEEEEVSLNPLEKLFEMSFLSYLHIADAPIPANCERNAP